MKNPVRSLCRGIFAALAVMSATAAFADTDVYGNTIKYESDGVTIKYRFWYGELTAEELSVADTVSASASPSVDFEPRHLTRATSDGNCRMRGLYLIVR